MLSILGLNDFVVLRANGTDDSILDATRQQAVHYETKDPEFWRQKLSSSRSPAFDKALEIESLL